MVTVIPFFFFVKQEVEQAANEPSKYVTLKKNIYDRKCRCAALASNRILHVQHRRATWISARSDNFFLFTICLPVCCRSPNRTHFPQMKYRICFSCSSDAQLVLNSFFFSLRNKFNSKQPKKKGAQLFDADNKAIIHFRISMSTFQNLPERRPGWDGNVLRGLWYALSFGAVEHFLLGR